MKKIKLFIWTIILSSCVYENKQPDEIEVAQPIYLENTITDTSKYFFENLSYIQICKELSILPYTPNETELKGSPNSYTEKIMDHSNYSKEDYERILKETDGKLFVDTTDRDFEKYWYNNNGLIERYENNRFGDMIHNECLFYYTDSNSIKKIEINGVVTDNYKYKQSSVIIENDTVTFLQHNISK